MFKTSCYENDPKTYMTSIIPDNINLKPTASMIKKQIITIPLDHF